MIAPARIAALDALRAINDGRRTLPEALADARAALEDARDVALTAEIVTGALRWQAQLDHLVTRFSSRRRIDPELRDLLRVSAYQIVHLDRVPAAAAVDDAVDLTRRLRKPAAAGFVNAVLRRVAAARHALPLPARPRTPPGRRAAAGGVQRDAALDYLSVTLSHPRWLVARWLDRLGFETAETWARFNNRPAPLTLRANGLKCSRTALAEALREAGIETRPTKLAPDGLVVRSGNPLRTPLYEAGLFIVQDEASQLVAPLASPVDGCTVLDACAAPGGKTLALAADIGRGRLIASDVRPGRVALLRSTMGRTGATRVRIVAADAVHPLPFRPVFDRVLVDAPCSGLGTIRRDPEIRWRRTEADLAGLARAQLAMLNAAADVVGPAGRLVYATCSTEPEENEAVIEAFLARAPGWERRDARSVLSAVAPSLESVVDTSGYLRTTPHAHGLEGFFGAILERAG